MDLVGALVSDAEETLKAAAEGRARGPITGLRVLDRMLGEALAPGLHMFSGDPGAGKTSLSLQVCGACGCPALYVTAEQTPLELFRRHVARATRTPLDDLRAAVPQKVRALAEQTAAATPMVAFLDATAGAASEGQMMELAEALRERFRARDVLLVVDSAQVWARGLFSGSEYDVLQSGLSALGAVSSRLRAPIIVLSHRSRASTRANDPLSAAKGTADFEHMGETVIHLSRQKDSGPAGAERTVQAHIAKNRHGVSDYTVNLIFDAEIQEFREG